VSKLNSEIRLQASGIKVQYSIHLEFTIYCHQS